MLSLDFYTILFLFRIYFISLFLKTHSILLIPPNILLETHRKLQCAECVILFILLAVEAEVYETASKKFIPRPSDVDDIKVAKVAQVSWNS